jgi:hypothetical protein
MLSIPLEFKIVEREAPDLDSTSKSGIRRGKIKEHDTPRWTSTWIPWDPQMDVSGFVRNLKRELAAVCVAARGEVERDLRSRIAEARILKGSLDDIVEGKTPPHPKFVTPSIVHTTSASSKRRRIRADDDDDEEEVYRSSRSQGSANRPSSYRTRSTGTSPFDFEARVPEPTMDIVEPAPRPPSVPKKTPGKVKLCQGCNEPSPVYKTVCASCGTDFPPRKPKPAPSSTASTNASGLGKGKKKCKNCGEKIASSKRECPKCFANCVGK